MNSDANPNFRVPPVNYIPSTEENPFLKKEDFEVEDVTEWNPAVSSRFANRVPKRVSRTVITVNERKLVFERSGGFFKLMGHLSDLVLLMFTVTLISTALGAVFIAGKITGVL